MIHAIRFYDNGAMPEWNDGLAGGTDTLADWGIALQMQPTFAMPPVRQHLLEIPGGDGVVDLSTAVTGYPVYGNRTGSFTFVAPVRQAAWQELIARIAELLHGQKLVAVLDDDPGWYYEGRFSLEYGRCEEQYGTIVVSYSVGPYRWSITHSTSLWLWDPFSFADGVVGNGIMAAESLDTDAVLSETDPFEIEYTISQTGQAVWNATFMADGIIDITGSAAFLTITDSENTYTYELLPMNPTTIPGLYVRGGRWWYSMGSEDRPVTVSATGAADGNTLSVTLIHSYSGAGAFTDIELPAELEFRQTGAAPVIPSFTISGDDATLTVRIGTDHALADSVDMESGNYYSVPGLVLYHGRWLYDGIPATVSAEQAEGGTTKLSVAFREGRL